MPFIGIQHPLTSGGQLRERGGLTMQREAGSEIIRLACERDVAKDGLVVRSEHLGADRPALKGRWCERHQLGAPDRTEAAVCG